MNEQETQAVFNGFILYWIHADDFIHRHIEPKEILELKSIERDKFWLN